MADDTGAVERVAHGERFHEAVMAKGIPFAAVLYLLLTALLLGTVGSIVEAVMNGAFLSLILPLLLGGLVIHYAREENLYGVVATVLVPYVVMGLLLTYLTATMLSSMFGTFTSPTLTTAAFTAIPVLLLGAVAAYLFNAVSTSRRGLGGPAVAGSALIAVGAGAARLVQASIRQIVETTSTNGGLSAPNGGLTPQSFLDMNAAPHPDVLFLTTLLAFNLPFLYYGNHRFSLGRQDMRWYLLPATIYVTVGVLGSILLF